MELDIAANNDTTSVGSYFVANYPPFSAWSPESVPDAVSALDRPPQNTDTPDPPPLGLYMHIPFCRKRCKFCYYRVYTDKNAADVDTYTDALAHEVALYAQKRALTGRQFDFVYFGGGTPSFLSIDQLNRLIDRIRKHWSWDTAREVTFECEPGTLRKRKLAAIKAIGVTRLSLGVEHFDDDILQVNGRAHKSPEIFRAYNWAREVDFDQINIDLIAGMVGETDDKWNQTLDRAVELDPDSVTIYQMELPHNTVLSRHAAATGTPAPVADWDTKRRWVDHAINRFEAAGYQTSGAYTLVKNARTRPDNPTTPADKPAPHGTFIYRDALWHGADMIGTGVASFSHLAGVHFQNVDGWDDYVQTIARGDLPLGRALSMSARQRLIRETILLLKTGTLSAAHFRDKFRVDLTDEFAEPIQHLVDGGFATVQHRDIHLTRRGLLRVDALLPEFFEPRFRGVRYT
ncbi:MAG: coproporphyrinogen-III oxidase family protein [Phycisphaerae bacterium]